MGIVNECIQCNIQNRWSEVWVTVTVNLKSNTKIHYSMLSIEYDNHSCGEPSITNFTEWIVSCTIQITRQCCFEFHSNCKNVITTRFCCCAFMACDFVAWNRVALNAISMKLELEYRPSKTRNKSLTSPHHLPSHSIMLKCCTDHSIYIKVVVAKIEMLELLIWITWTWVLILGWVGIWFGADFLHWKGVLGLWKLAIVSTTLMLTEMEMSFWRNLSQSLHQQFSLPFQCPYLLSNFRLPNPSPWNSRGQDPHNASEWYR